MEKTGGKEMRKVILYIAMSLDGYIADSRGGVDWLGGQEAAGEDTGTYDEFVKGIDTILMGWNTYHQVVTELSPQQWIYKDFITYVITHRESRSTEQIRFTDESPVSLLKGLKEQEGKDIWVCGGASLAGQLMEADLIDLYRISIIPTILGSGIRLFGALSKEQKLTLTGTRRNHGIVELTYRRRESKL